MIINITTGTGKGPTPLAAFDTALISAGIANYNLLYLSSVIPPSASIVMGYDNIPAEYGHRLYTVMARQDEILAGKMAVAGLGWVQSPTGRGLFVEIHGQSNEQVEDDIRSTLTSMVKNRGIDYGNIKTRLASIPCEGLPVCAIVAAVYQSERWNA